MRLSTISTSDSTPEEIARAQRKFIEAERDRVKAWLDNNDFHVSNKSLTRNWIETRDRVAHRLISLIVQYLAISEGASLADETVKFKLKMDLAGIDLRQFEILATRFFRIEVTRLLADNSNLSKAEKQRIVDRQLASSFPDGTVPNTDSQVVKALSLTNKIGRGYEGPIPQKQNPQGRPQGAIPSSRIKQIGLSGGIKTPQGLQRKFFP